jgi:glycosyltransferase involved in cell wall biosynthesis
VLLLPPEIQPNSDGVGGSIGSLLSMPHKPRASYHLRVRITFDHQAFSLQRTGGITRYFYELINGLSNLAADVQITALLGFSTSVWPLADALRGSGSMIRLGSQLFQSTRTTYAINELISSVVALGLKRADIYHSTLYRFLPSIRAKRKVATNHDCIHELYPELFPNHEHVTAMKRRMFAEADLIFCVSEASRGDMQKLYSIEDAKIRVVHHGVAPLQRNESGQKRLEKLVQRPFVLFVGHRGLYKNFTGLLNAFASIGASHDFDLLTVGGGAPTEAEQRLATSLQLGDAVKWLPIADTSALAEAYSSAALFVYPSLYEGFGMPPLEAMLAGCPTLVASNPATREVLKDSSTLFDPYDAQDFAEKLAHLLKDDSDRLKNITKGAELASSYTWEKAIQKTLAGYQAIL